MDSGGCLFLLDSLQGVFVFNAYPTYAWTGQLLPSSRKSGLLVLQALEGEYLLVWNISSVNAWRVGCNASAVLAASPVALLGSALAYPRPAFDNLDSPRSMVLDPV